LGLRLGQIIVRGREVGFCLIVLAYLGLQFGVEVISVLDGGLDLVLQREELDTRNTEAGENGHN
jgi:hypothetical protein